jgi:Fe-S-cluster containining protein
VEPTAVYGQKGHGGLLSGPFSRTTCACDDCLACCKRQPGYLVLEDIGRIGEYLGEAAEGYLVASPGALLGRVTPDGVETFRVGSIVPRTVDAEGRCVFLDDEGRCVIHAVAPFGCAAFDTHQHEGEYEERANWGIRQMMDPEYQKRRATLPPATTYRPR